MQTEHQSLTQLPYRAEVPFETRHAVLEERLSAEQAEVRRLGEGARRMNRAVLEYRDHAIRLMGGHKYEQFRAYLKEQKRSRAKFFFPPRGAAMSQQEIDRFRAERTEESHRWLRDLGVDVRQLRELSQHTADAMMELVPATPTRDGKPVMILLPSEIPPEIRAHKTNPWTIVGPPYGWAWWYTTANDGFSFFPTLYLDAGSGLIGNISFLRDSDASDNDYGYTHYSTAVSFWYQMPTPGLVEVWIEAQSRGSHHHLSLWDEFGWSDSSVNQHDYLTLKATTGGSASEPQTSEMSSFFAHGQTEGYWDNHYLTDGATYWAHLFSDPRVVLPTGAWVLVEVGMLNFNSAFSNDVEVYSTLDFSWIIKHVHVHSTGG